MKKNATLVRKRRGARRRSKLKLMLKLVVSFVFLATAALLSAGIVQVVERPVAPWKTAEEVAEVARPTPISVGEDGGLVEVDPVEPVKLSEAIDPQLGEAMLRETRIDDLAEADQPLYADDLAITR